MATKIETDKYTGIPYCFENGPGKNSDRDLDRKNGINCEKLTHWMLEDEGLPLPNDMRSKEIFEDDRLFKTVEQSEELKPLDIFIWGSEDCTDPRKLHLAVHTGKRDEQNNPLLIHANIINGKVSIWPLREFPNHPRYRKLFAVKRRIEEP